MTPIALTASGAAVIAKRELLIETHHQPESAADRQLQLGTLNYRTIKLPVTPISDTGAGGTSGTVRMAVEKGWWAFCFDTPVSIFVLGRECARNRQNQRNEQQRRCDDLKSLLSKTGFWSLK